jgi:hypothetical protein
MNVRKKAASITKIFHVLSQVVAVFGGTTSFFVFISGFSDTGDPVFFSAIAIIIALATTITWAGISLAALIAGYIAERSTSEMIAWAYPQPQQPKQSFDQHGPQWREEPRWMEQP